MMTRAVYLFAAAMCLCLAGCEERKVYPMAVSEMREVLRHVDELPPVFGSQAPNLTKDFSDPLQLAWIVDLDGSKVMRFVATLRAENQQSTHLALDLVGLTSSTHGNVEQRFKKHPELRKLYVVAMLEQIESKLEKRPFDISKTYGALAAATAANMGTISGRMNDAADAASIRDEQNIRKAYADEAAGN